MNYEIHLLGVIPPPSGAGEEERAYSALRRQSYEASVTEVATKAGRGIPARNAMLLALAGRPSEIPHPKGILFKSEPAFEP